MTKQSARSNEATWYIPRLKTLRNMYHLKQSDFDVDKKNNHNCREKSRC